MMTKQYTTARAFREALEERLRQISRNQHIDIMRLRRIAAFDRLLARLFTPEDQPWLLKGGYALELRLSGRARATRDIDLTIPAPDRISQDGIDLLQAIRERLQDAATQDLSDWFVFRIGAPVTDIEGAPYGGARYPAETRMDNRVFATFHLDIGLGDAVISAPEWITDSDLLSFAGIAPAHIALLSKEQQFAEKIHAYTLPRGDRGNSRVKDLVDLTILIGLGLASVSVVLQALGATFKRRGTHQLPEQLPPPPDDWQAPYAALAAECQLSAATMNEAFAMLTEYWTTLRIKETE